MISGSSIHYLQNPRHDERVGVQVVRSLQRGHGPLGGPRQHRNRRRQVRLHHRRHGGRLRLRAFREGLGEFGEGVVQGRVRLSVCILVSKE